MRRPSGEVVAPAEQCAGEQAWYSDSDKLKHHEGISTFSIGALILAEKLDSTKVMSSIFRSPIVLFMIDEISGRCLRICNAREIPFSKEQRSAIRSIEIGTVARPAEIGNEHSTAL